MTQTPQPVQQVQSTGEALIDPVVEHAERLTRVEGNLTQTEERLNRQVLETEGALRKAIEESGGAATERVNTLMSRLETLEEKLNAMAVHPVKTSEETAVVAAQPVEGAVTFVTPPIEESPAPPERERRSIRHKRKNRRAAKK